MSRGTLECNPLSSGPGELCQRLDLGAAARRDNMLSECGVRRSKTLSRDPSAERRGVPPQYQDAAEAKWNRDTPLRNHCNDISMSAGERSN